MAQIPNHMWSRVPKGWYGFAVPYELVPLLIEFDEKMRKIAPQYEIHQIKEKLWTLRIYLDPGEKLDEEQMTKYYDLINEYETKGTALLAPLEKDCREQ